MLTDNEIKKNERLQAEWHKGELAGKAKLYIDMLLGYVEKDIRSNILELKTNEDKIAFIESFKIIDKIKSQVLVDIQNGVMAAKEFSGTLN